MELLWRHWVALALVLIGDLMRTPEGVLGQRR